MMRCFSEMREGRKRVTIAMVLTVFAITVLLVLVLAAPTATNFGVDDTSGDSGTYVLVPVSITNTQGGPVAGIGFNISYNNSVINVVGIQAGGLTTDWDWVFSDYTNYPWGTAVAIVYNGSGTEIGDDSTGSVVMLNFSVLGAPGTTSPMNLTNIQLSDLNGNVGTAPAKNGTFTVTHIPIPEIFDTGSPANPYPSISGIHNGTIRPNQAINVSKLYTYSCAGTGGHTKYVKIWIWNSTINATATWNGYQGDWHNISFNDTFVLYKNETYNYTIITGSYPQIIHEPSKDVTGGTINCTSFVDVNGKTYTDWIPAIRLE